MKFILPILLLLISTIAFAGDLTLVSGNTINFPGGSGIYPANTPYVDTNAEVKLVTTGEFATDEESTKTFDNSLKTDVKGISNGKCAYTDGTCLAKFGMQGNIMDQTWSTWGGGKYVTVIFDLKKVYPIAKIDVISLTNGQCFTSRFEVLMSVDGQKWYPRGSFLNNDEREPGKWSTISSYISPAIEAQYVELRIIKDESTFQQQLGEIAIWADLGKDAKIIKADKLDPVKFTPRAMGFGAIYVDFSDFAKEKRPIKEYKIYVSDKRFQDVKKENITLYSTVPATKSSAPIYPVDPGKTYFIGVTAVYNSDIAEYSEVDCKSIKMPRTFEAKTFGDMLSINHYPYGGAFAQHREAQKEWEIVAFDILQTIPFKEHRWWLFPEDWTKEAYNRGIGRLSLTGQSDDRLADAAKLGVFAIEVENEPDFGGVAPEKYAENLKKSYANAKKVNPNFIVTAPTVGTEDASLEWIDNMYKAGAKDYFDVFDSHPYCKVGGGHKEPAGVEAGAPECLIDDIGKLKKIMAKYGDQNKPIIASEFGFADIVNNNPSGKLDRQMQAEYLSRGLVLQNILGIKRVFIYAFFDAGTDPFNHEHHFGLIDWYAQKKPSFYAVQTLSEQIGDYSYAKEVVGAKSPVFGYTYEKDASFISVVWNAGGAKTSTFKTLDKEVKIVNLYGDKEKTVQVTNGKFTTELGKALIFIHHKTPLSIVN